MVFFVSQSITLPPVSSIALARYLTKTKFSIDVLAKLGKENSQEQYLRSKQYGGCGYGLQAPSAK